MVAARLLAVVFAGLLLVASDSFAKDHGKNRGSGRRDRGPAFCRSGAGHPVFGWRWCEERGWTRDGFLTRDRDRDRDRRTSRSRFPWPF